MFWKWNSVDSLQIFWNPKRKDKLNLTKLSIPLTLSWRRSLSCRKQSIDLPCKSTDWFLYDRDFLQEVLKNTLGCPSSFNKQICASLAKNAIIMRHVYKRNLFNFFYYLIMSIQQNSKINYWSKLPSKSKLVNLWQQDNIQFIFHLF